MRDLAKVICDQGIALSRCEARRQITQGSIRVNGKRIEDPKAQISNDAKVQHIRRRRTDLDFENDLGYSG